MTRLLADPPADALARAWATDCYTHYDPPGHSWAGPSRLAWAYPDLDEPACKRCGTPLHLAVAWGQDGTASLAERRGGGR